MYLMVGFPSHMQTTDQYLLTQVTPEGAGPDMALLFKLCFVLMIRRVIVSYFITLVWE